MSRPSTNAAPPTPRVSATTEAVPAVRMAAPLATLRAFSASSRSYASEAGGDGGVGDGDGVEVFAWTSATGWDAFLGVRLNLGAAGPALGLTRGGGGGGGGVAAAGAGAGSSLRFHTAFDAGASPVVTGSFSTFSSFSSTGGRSKDVLVSTRAMTSSPKE